MEPDGKKKYSTVCLFGFPQFRFVILKEREKIGKAENYASVAFIFQDICNEIGGIQKNERIVINTL